MSILENEISFRDFTTPIYEMIGDIHDNRAVVKKKGSLYDQYGYIDSDGNEVLPCLYSMANRFSEGLAVVRKDGHQIVIDIDGNEVLNIDEYTVPMKDASFSEGFLNVLKDGKSGFVDKSGKEVIPCRYDVATKFCEGLALVSEGQNRFYINKDGQKQLQENGYYFDLMESEFHNGLARVYLDSQRHEMAFIDNQGNVIGKDHQIFRDVYYKNVKHLEINSSVREKLVIYCSEVNMFGSKINLSSNSKDGLKSKKIEMLSSVQNKIKQIEQSIKDENSEKNVHM